MSIIWIREMEDRKDGERRMRREMERQEGLRAGYERGRGEKDEG